MKRFFYILTFISSLLRAQQQYLDLGSAGIGKWLYHAKENNTKYPATVPGNIYSDLRSNSQIPDPYMHEEKVQWVENTDWEYTCSFDVKEDQLMNYTHAELNMHDVDTYASVYLNDSLVFVCNNMFRTWTKDIKPLLRKGKNELHVKFESAVKCAKAEAAKLPYALPEGERVFARKAQFHFGWDFAPRLAGCSLGSVKIQFWKNFRMVSFSVEQPHVDSSLADLHVTVAIESEVEQEISARLIISDHHAHIAEQKKMALLKNINHIIFDCKIESPSLWWCHGMGRPDLYKLMLSIGDSKGEIIREEKKIGLRTIELVQDTSRRVATTGSATNTSFYFRLNGKAVFMKGANFIPSSSLPFEIPDSTFPKLATELNMNMLRVWGGGVYASDAFYSACDREGILVWQDLMFACAMYPGDDAFLKNVEHEVAQQAIRLRDHPCLALWCGNNENDEGWQNWGWQKQFRYSAKDSAEIWHNYQQMFHKLIPGVLSQVSPDIAYHPSSPLIGWGHAESMLRGDSHYWGVWWGKEPFEAYKRKTGRFMSEYGFQGMSSLESFQKFCKPDELALSSEAVQKHQKNKGGYQTIQTYMERDYPVPSTFEDYIYVSQLLQAHGMSIAIESHRRKKPYCMGSLFWQLNDCWPVTSWSAVDFYGEPKALYYEARRQFKAVSLSAEATKDSVAIYVVSDSMQALSGKLQVRLSDFHGKVLWKKSTALDVKANSVSQFSFGKKEMPAFDSTAVYLHVSFEKKDHPLAEKNVFFTRFKHLQLPKAEIQVKQTSSGDHEIKSNVFAKDAALYFEGGVKLSDNFFDLEPGIVKTVKAHGSYVKTGREKPRVQVLNNLINLH